MAGLLNKAKEMLHAGTGSTTNKEHDTATMTSTTSHTSLDSSNTESRGPGEPHSSGLLNKHDSTVDTSRDRSSGLGNTTGIGSTGTGTHLGSNTTGTHHHHDGGEHHHTTFAGAVLDPACDPKTAHVTGVTDTRVGSTTSQGLTSDKQDPRLDSDRTYVNQGIDATKMPPSVVQEIIGEPVIEHGEPGYDRARRHSLKPADDLQRYGSGMQ